VTTASPEQLGLMGIAAALDRGAPLDEVLGLVDIEIGRAETEHDITALQSLATRLDEAAKRLGDEGRGLAVAAARARAAIPEVEPTINAEPMPGPWQAGAPVAEPAPLAYASWIRRVGGFLVDWAALFLAISIFAGATGASHNAILLLFAFVPVLYFAALHWAFGRTLGKQLFGIQVRSGEGRRIYGGEAIIRTLTQALLALTLIGFPLDSLWPLIDNRNRALHDKIVGTIVVRRST